LKSKDLNKGCWALTVSFDLLAVFIGLHKERKLESLSTASGEAVLHHSGVREKDPVEGEAGSLDWVFVHFIY